MTTHYCLWVLGRWSSCCRRHGGRELLGTCVGRAGPQRFVGCLPPYPTQACLYGQAGLVHAPDCSNLAILVGTLFGKWETSNSLHIPKGITANCYNYVVLLILLRKTTQRYNKRFHCIRTKIEKRKATAAPLVFRFRHLFCLCAKQTIDIKQMFQSK